MESIEKYAVQNRRAVYVLLFLMTTFMHLFWLDRIPFGIHVDEAGMAYDAWCLANYSVDRYLNHMPVYLINFGGGQSALYAYLTAILIKLTGDVGMWAIRLPGAVIGICAWIAGVQIVRMILNEKWGMISAFLLAVFPYFTMQSRFGLDCNLLLGMTTIGVYFLLLAVRKRRISLFVLSGIIWGTSYYTYALSFISSSLFLAGALLYWLYYRKLRWRDIIAFVAPAFLLALPLALMLVINIFELPEIKTAFFTIPRMTEFRGSEISFNELWKNLTKMIRVILTKDWLGYNAFDKYFTMYRLSIPFAVAGFLMLIVNAVKSFIYRRYSVWNIILLLFLSNLAVGMLLGGDGPNINRANGIFFALFLCVIYGIRTGYHWLKGALAGGARPDSLKDALQRIPFLEKRMFLFVLLIYSINFLTFFRYYFFIYPRDVYPQYLFRDTYEELLPFIEANTGQPKVVYVDASYVYYFLSAKVDPFEADIRNNGSDTYWKFAFYLPDEVEDDEVYVVHEKSRDFIEMAEEAEFLSHQEGQFICYYKN